MELLTPNNSYPVVIFLFLIGFSFLTSIFIVRHKKNRVNYFLSISTLLFLIFYFPIFEYWSIWTELSFWPQDFYPQYGGGSPLYTNDYQNYTLSFRILSTVSQYLLFLSIFLFIHKINDLFNITQTKKKLIQWIPLINILNIGQKLFKYFKGNILIQIVLGLWTIFSILWIFYRFFAGPLSLIGIDSLSFIDQILFGDQYKEAIETHTMKYPIDMSYTMVTDLLNIITPFFTFVSGLLTYIIIIRIKKTSANKV
ncbi:hypothetical protein [Thalassobellus citreus]|uniref:hypothetical protein n=1 Tax=Thalassobellus citreus TaxID=3367752 RepID=UPI0037A79F2F